MTASSWLVTAAAGFACSWIVSPPVSTAGRAAWAALTIGFFATASLLAFDHRAALVVALPVVVASAPLAVIRRHRAGVQTQEIPAAHRRLWIGAFGTLLFALGVNIATLNPEAQWAGPVLVLGAALVAGILPFHRPSTETLRAAPADIRTPVLLLLGPALWMALVHWMPQRSFSGYSSLLPMLTLWLGAFLVLARGDIPRLSTAALLYAAGQVGMSAVGSTVVAANVAAATTAPLLVVVLLLAKLERSSETRDLSELGGLALRLPRYSIALLVAVFWLIGTASATPLRMLLTLALNGQLPTSPCNAFREVWPVFMPHVIAVWGWLIVLQGLLVGPARSPLFPEPLRDRVSMPPADRPLEDLSTKELAALIGFAVIAMSV
jgi:hypothetical protein